jgi:hypothetical protein
MGRAARDLLPPGRTDGPGRVAGLGRHQREERLRERTCAVDNKAVALSTFYVLSRRTRTNEVACP